MNVLAAPLDTTTPFSLLDDQLLGRMQEEVEAGLASADLRINGIERELAVAQEQRESEPHRV